MAYSGNNRIAQAQRMLDRLAVDRKKAVFAVCLFAVMGFMWFRVLTGHKPGPAAASTAGTPVSGKTQKPPQNIHFIELPKLQGRNDYINRDFFASHNWGCFRQEANPSQDPGATPGVTAPDRTQEVAARLGQALKLEAVMKDGTPRAYINDRLLRLGDRFPVHDGPDTCEFEVLRIYEDSVLLGCNGTQLTLKLTQHVDVDK